MSSLLSSIRPDPAVTPGPRVPEERDTAWHACPAQQALERLESHSDGLTEQMAASRLAVAGANVFRAARPVTGWKILRTQFRSLLVALLVVAAAIAAVTGDPADAAAIGAVLVLNVAIGFATELRAHRAMEGLVRLDVPIARVIRRGRSRVIDARELVPGDVILLEAGQTVPADARLLACSELATVEAALKIGRAHV